jgi:predicted nucleotidyltransferase component of viral defense system
VIPRAHITAWRRTTPWLTDAQVEQDLILSRALVEIFTAPALSSQLAFRGGTALHKLYLGPPSRYSEDIDLVQVEAGPIGAVMTALHAQLDPWLGEPRRKQSQGRVAFLYRFDSEIPPITPLRLKVEVNTREHFAVLGFTRKPLVMENPWFAGKADILTYELEELLGTKLRALYQRKAGRDLFDLGVALTGSPEPDAEKIMRCFLRYMDYVGATVSRAEFEANLAGKLTDSEFLSDAGPLLAPRSSQFDPIAAAEVVMTKLIARLPGEPWKGNR